jgi:hypothetical protein
MKLIFLGDSFTYGHNIDIEFGLKNKLLNGSDIYFNPKNIDENILKKINDFRINNNWPALISKELNLEHENLSIQGSGIEMIYCKFLENEKNKKEDSFYIIGLPMNSGRKLVSRKNSQKDFSDLYYTYHFKNDIETDFFKKYFDEKYFGYIYINITLSIVSYCKNKRIPFLFLPTWYSNIENHFNFTRDIIIKDYLKHFFLNEIKDQLNFFIDLKLIKKLPCFHPNIQSQNVIKNMYINYIKDNLKNF